MATMGGIASADQPNNYFAQFAFTQARLLDISDLHFFRRRLESVVWHDGIFGSALLPFWERMNLASDSGM